MKHKITVKVIDLFNFFILGRPEKLPDVCYSWWVLASLKVIGKLHWIDKVKKCYLSVIWFQNPFLQIHFHNALIYNHLGQAQRFVL